MSDLDRLSWEELQRRADALRDGGYHEAAKAMQKLAEEKRWPDFAMALYSNKRQ